MLDGRIDTQGTVNELRAKGILEGIEHDAAIDEHSEAKIEAEIIAVEAATADAAKPSDAEATKKPRKLIKDEHRETGGVKWSIYKSYLKASYVFSA